jgi:hypothetical protein
MFSILGQAPLRTSGAVWGAFNHVERAVVIAGSVLCGFACVLTGQLLGMPREPGFNGSLLASGAPASALLVILLALAFCTVVAFVVTALIDIQSGLFCCCMGLAWFGIHCGPMRPVLQYAGGPGVFISMGLETTILGAAIVGIWLLLKTAVDRSRRSATGELNLAAPNEIVDAPTSQKVLTTAVQVVVMGVCELILIQSDTKPQAMAGAGIAAFLGVLAAYMFTPLPKGIWYWIGPVILGVIGYALAFIMGGYNGVGDVHGWTAALARPTPLDYAGMGTGGALLGYWCSRRWAQPEESDEAIAAE